MFRARHGAAADLLAVGLGNPEPEYQGTRHNLGAEAVKLLAERHGGSFRRARGLRSLACEARVGGRLLAMALPQTWMNESGSAVSALRRRYGVEDLARLVVVHDELDLPPGRVRVKVGGGTAGHNGLGSIVSHLHDGGFVRVRIGVGKPPGRMEGADYVLRRIPKAERGELEVAVAEAADAVEQVLTEGPASAMTRFNATG